MFSSRKHFAVSHISGLEGHALSAVRPGQPNAGSNSVVALGESPGLGAKQPTDAARGVSEPAEIIGRTGYPLYP